MSTPRVAILGAGVSGLTAAWTLQRRGVRSVVFEAGPRIAGMAESHMGDDGFSFDVGAHFVTNRLAAAVGISADCRVVRRYGEVVRMPNGSFLQYPLGLIKVPRYTLGALTQRMLSGKTEVVSVADRFRGDYGRAMTEEVANPIVESWSGVAADTLSAAVADKVPTSILQTIWLRAAQRLSRRAVAIGYCGDQPQNAGVFHVYPRHGVSEICRAIANRLEEPVRLSSPAKRIFVEDEKVVGLETSGETIETSHVISTLPVNRLGSLVEGSRRLEPFQVFQYRGLVLVNLKMEGRGLLPEVVVWTPSQAPFFRLTEAPMSMPWLAPPGKTIVLAELGATVGDETWSQPDDECIRLCVEGIRDFVPDVDQRLIGAKVLRQPLGYPVFSLSYESKRLDLVTNGTGIAGLLSIGRNGQFAHLLMEDIFWRTVRQCNDLAETLGRG